MVIGVTGGVGAGKSTVLKILKEKYGAHIIIADDVARELMEPGGASYALVLEAFGTEILDLSSEGGKRIDRAKLAAIVFEDDEKLALLNSLTHPQVRMEILSRISRFYEEDPDALIVLEAALLIEGGYREILDCLWAVCVDTEVRIGRLMRDRGYSREKALSIMDNQLSDSEFRAHADFVINNSGTVAQTEAQIDTFFESCRS